MASLNIGEIELRHEQNFTRQYETAAWYQAGKFEPQTVELRLVDNYWLCATFKGEVTGSNFTSLYGGVAVGKGKVDEDVGQAMEHGLQMNTYLVANMLDPIAAEKPFLVTLNELGKEKLASYLPPLPGESVDEYAIRAVGMREHTKVSHVSIDEVPQDDSVQQVKGFFIGDDFYFATLRKDNSVANPYTNPEALVCKFQPDEFKSLFIELAERGISDSDNRRSLETDKRFQGLDRSNYVYLTEGLESGTIASVRAEVSAEGQVFEVRADLKEPIPEYRMQTTVVSSVHSVGGSSLTDLSEKALKQVDEASRSMAQTITSRFTAKEKAVLTNLLPVMTSDEYERVLDLRSEQEHKLSASSRSRRGMTP